MSPCSSNLFARSMAVQLGELETIPPRVSTQPWPLRCGERSRPNPSKSRSRQPSPRSASPLQDSTEEKLPQGSGGFASPSLGVHGRTKACSWLGGGHGAEAPPSIPSTQQRGAGFWIRHLQRSQWIWKLGLVFFVFFLILVQL